MIKPRPAVAQAALADEFAEADLGDARRARRLMAIARKLAAAPDASFPSALETGADLEGFYRFTRNDAVTPEAILAPHVAATARRVSEHSEVLAVHDTTECRYGGSRAGLGRLTTSGHGFLAHYTLAVTSDERRDPLGTLALETWTRHGVTPTALRRGNKITPDEAITRPNEQDRWLRGVDAAEAAVDGPTRLIHVMYSEADDYDLMSKLVEGGQRWVIRLCHDRVLATPEGFAKAKEFVARRKVKCTRAVQLSRRKRRPGGSQRRRQIPRDQRLATLAIRASAVIFRRPMHYRASTDLSDTLPVNIVAVREIEPPVDEQRVEWLLMTTEPIDTEDAILKVIDWYRARWRIEEFFRALKTGCALEKRQLESRETLLNALALFTAIAWALLRLRTAARADEDISAHVVLDDEQLTVLRKASEVPLPRRLSARDAMSAVARLGGHLRSNGDPGWVVLGRGYEKLVTMVAGYRLALGK